jgi:lysophospholipase L1-like esterase
LQRLDPVQHFPAAALRLISGEKKMIQAMRRQLRCASHADMPRNALVFSDGTVRRVVNPKREPFEHLQALPDNALRGRTPASAPGYPNSLPSLQTVLIVAWQASGPYHQPLINPLQSVQINRIGGTRMRPTFSIALISGALIGLLLADAADAQSQQTPWISTWTASPQSPRGVMPASFSNLTVRQVVHVSIGGNKVRIHLSNEFATKPVLIGTASVGLMGNSDIISGSLRPVTFGGSKSIILLPGAPALSDPVEINVAPLSDVAVNLYLPAATDLGTVHQVGLQTAFVSAAGDFTTGSEFPVADKFANRFFLAGVMVEPASPARAIATFGDSITDGTNSTANTNSRWPDVLARRLKEAGMPVAVLNQGISGNRILSDGAGISALARFERDVLSQPGLSHVVILLGINDIGWPGTAIETVSPVRTVDEMIAGYKQMIERAHLRGIKVIGSPLTPFENAFAGMPNQGYYTPDKEAKRLAVNNWIRTSGAFDGIIDFGPVLGDPGHPSVMNPAYDSGDHLHPNDAGYKAMGESIDLKLFQ